MANGRLCKYSIHCLLLFSFSPHTTFSVGSCELRCHNMHLPVMPSGIPSVPRHQSSLPLLRGHYFYASAAFHFFSLGLTGVINYFDLYLQVQNFTVLSAIMQNFHAFTWVSLQYYICVLAPYKIFLLVTFLHYQNSLEETELKGKYEYK